MEGLNALPKERAFLGAPSMQWDFCRAENQKGLTRGHWKWIVLTIGKEPSHLLWGASHLMAPTAPPYSSLAMQGRMWGGSDCYGTGFLPVGPGEWVDCLCQSLGEEGSILLSPFSGSAISCPAPAPGMLHLLLLNHFLFTASRRLPAQSNQSSLDRRLEDEGPDCCGGLWGKGRRRAPWSFLSHNPIHSGPRVHGSRLTRLGQGPRSRKNPFPGRPRPLSISHSSEVCPVFPRRQYPELFSQSYSFDDPLHRPAQLRQTQEPPESLFTFKFLTDSRRNLGRCSRNRFRAHS